MELKKGEKVILNRIKKLFEELDECYSSLSRETQYEIYDFHYENYTIPHCIRWGLQGSEEILKHIEISRRKK
mgnify:CR=1 FL=1|jgi:calcineurin-like phosphoesterase